MAVPGCVPPPAGKGQTDSTENKHRGSEVDESMTKEQEPPLPGIDGFAALRVELEKVLQSKGEDYQARTEHKDEQGAPEFTNRLIRESSPYLLQHAHNPVNWHPWGDEAFAKAKRLGRPVLLSIGYSTCHWCHVMERESFEDKEIAAYINRHYVAIKVDREQRPDVDDIYMTAVQIMTGRGGWPMTLVLTPDRDPFFAGTYFPARDGDRGARRGFFSILKQMAASYADDSTAVLARAAAVSRKIASSSARGIRGKLPSVGPVAEAAKEVSEMYDERWGGFGHAPKFPRASNLELLLRYARRSKDLRILSEVAGTVEKMIEGGIHDHVGGGFHRYSTDRQWLVPHFEKMLYDNAQIVVVMAELWQCTQSALFRDVALETLGYLDREMSDSGGGFYSATDADSPVPGKKHQEEGWYFTWTPDEIDNLLGADERDAVRAYYAVSQSGNFEGRNIFHTPRSTKKVAAELGIDPKVLIRRVDAGRSVLYQARMKRPAPLRDDKLLASWNGLALSAFARGGFVFGDEKILARAQKLANFILVEMRDSEGRLLRSLKDGQNSGRGYLDDYAFTIQGLLDLYEADGNPRWLRESLALQKWQDKRHLDDDVGGYFTTADDGENLLVRPKPDYDGAEPSGNSVAALNLLRLGEFTGATEYRGRAEKLLGAFSGRIGRSPQSVPKMLSALDFAHDRPFQIYLIYPTKSHQTSAPDADMVEVLRRTYVPNRIVVLAGEDSVAAHMTLVPGIEGKIAMGGKTTAYVCESNICQKPTSDPSVFRKQLDRVHSYADGTSPG